MNLTNSVEGFYVIVDMIVSLLKNINIVPYFSLFDAVEVMLWAGVAGGLLWQFLGLWGADK